MPDAATLEPLEPTPKPRKVLVTGAAGRIGSYFAEHAPDRFDLRLMVRGDERDLDRLKAWGEVVEADLSDLKRLKQACAGIDTVVHMAGDPDASAEWESLHATNIVGTYNVFVAAKAAGCRRVIYASAIHAVSGYPAGVQVKPDEPVNPGDLYGVSKCFGEALARYMAEQEGVSAICLRIGAFQPLEHAQGEDLANLDAFVSHRDLHGLIVRSIDDERLKFAIFHGLSDNAFKRLDISNAKELVGYAPVDDFAHENPRLAPLELDETVITHSAVTDGAPSGLRADLG
ncbi:NAD(P)-dependent oxidoreductase [bacterium]|nr:MAG: NAD(P)-dependent oxidoreductase [bacterium]